MLIYIYFFKFNTNNFFSGVFFIMRTSDKRYFEDSKLVQDFLRDVPNKLNREVETGVDSNGNYIITIKTSAGTTTHKQYRSPDTYHRVGD